MKRLVVNGCSYMKAYEIGNGHVDLANKLNITKSVSLAKPGSCNSRIIRTTLKDSYLTVENTLYIVGLTFLSRTELPIADTADVFEGKWVSIQNKFNPAHRYNNRWTQDDAEKFIEIKLKAELYSIDDYLEQLMYQVLSMVNDLISRGHQIIVFCNPADSYDDRLDDPRFTKLHECVNIVDGLKWKAIPWQATQGVNFDPNDSGLPFDIRHPVPGEHDPLNKFLIEYMNKNEIHLSVL